MGVFTSWLLAVWVRHPCDKILAIRNYSGVGYILLKGAYKDLVGRLRLSFLEPLQETFSCEIEKSVIFAFYYSLFRQV